MLLEIVIVETLFGCNSDIISCSFDCLCGLVVRIPGYRSRSPGSSPIYKNMVNSICIFRSGDVQVNLWMLQWRNIILLTVRLSLLISRKLSFLIVGLKMFSLPTFAPTTPHKMFIWYVRNLSNTHSSCHRNCLSHHQFYPLLGHDCSEQWYDTSNLSVLHTTSSH
jgi:hypothetical protein